MNIYSLIGFTLATLVFFVGLRLASEDLNIFLDYPSLFIVIGGTIAATAISFQLNRILFLLKVFFERVIQGKKFDYRQTVQEIIQIAESYRKGESLNQLANNCSDPFLKECLELAAEGVVEAEELQDTFLDRAEKTLYYHLEEAKKMKTIAKYPPAFGMMGTTIGMIVLLANLGGEDALKMIGPAMGVCLITTLYGVAIANLIITPIGENLSDNAKEIFLKNQIIVDGVGLLLNKTNPILLSVKLNSYLEAKNRIDWKKAIGRA